MGTAITAATARNGQINFSHVGIALVKDGIDSVLEATTDGGVRVIARKEFVEQAAKIDGRPIVTAMRLRDTTGVAAAIERALSHLGEPYDYSYLPDNGKMYCSELAWASYLAPDGSPLFHAQPMNFRSADGTMPPFWVALFEQLGEPIPEGVPGTNPNDLSHEPILYEIGRWY